MDGLRRWLDRNVKQVVFFSVVLLVLVIGGIVPGGAGDTIEAIGGAALAIGILVTVGISSRPPRRRRRKRWPY